MPAPTPPFVVQMTPPGRGAVATLRIEGSGAVNAVQAVFRARGGRPLGEYPPDRIVVGRIGAGDGRAGEEVVVCRRGGDAVELHCHGGLAAIAAIEEGLAAAGCRPITWRQWAERQSNDPIAAAAIVALAEACTQRTAAILLDQYHGRCGGRLRKSKRPSTPATPSGPEDKQKRSFPARRWATPHPALERRAGRAIERGQEQPDERARGTPAGGCSRNARHDPRRRHRSNRHRRLAGGTVRHGRASHDRRPG